MIEELLIINIPPDVATLVCKQNFTGFGMPFLFHERVMFDMLGTDSVPQIK